HRCPAGLTVAYDSRLRGIRMKLAHAVHELALGVAHVQQCLARFGGWEEDDEVHRVPCVQCDPDLGIVLEATDARTVTSARVDNHEGTAFGVHGHAFGRNDA